MTTVPKKTDPLQCRSMLYEGTGKAAAAVDGLASPEIPTARTYLVVESDIHEESMHICPEER